MLAKLWKKVLLGICIIACLFNITSKLVNRHSLKENLQSVNDGKTIFDLSGKDSSSGSNKGSTKANGEQSSGGNSGENSGAASTSKRRRVKDDDGHVTIYDEDGNIVDEYDIDDEQDSNGNNGDENSDRDDDDYYDGEIDIDPRKAASKVKDKAQEFNDSIEPVEAEESYDTVPVYEEDDPQRSVADNAEREFTIRDFFGLFKSEDN